MYGRAACVNARIVRTCGKALIMHSTAARTCGKAACMNSRIVRTCSAARRTCGGAPSLHSRIIHTSSGAAFLFSGIVHTSKKKPSSFSPFPYLPSAPPWPCSRSAPRKAAPTTCGHKAGWNARIPRIPDNFPSGRSTLYRATGHPVSASSFAFAQPLRRSKACGGPAGHRVLPDVRRVFRFHGPCMLVNLPFA